MNYRMIAAAACLALAGCDDNPLAKSTFIQDEAQCASTADPSACRQQLADARAEHMRTAPAFTDKQGCEAKFGVDNCMQKSEVAASGTPTGGSGSGGSSSGSGGSGLNAGQQMASAGEGHGMFMPMLMGFMMGQALGNMTARPVYRDINNTAYSGNQQVGKFNSSVTPPPRAPGQPVQAAAAPKAAPKQGTAPSRGFGGFRRR